jgi:phosphatidylglycerophosphate synthase
MRDDGVLIIPSVAASRAQPVGGLTAAEALAWTGADVITGARTLTAVVCGVLSLQLHDVTWLVAAYAAYWIGDTLDGVVARQMGTERRAGAVLDIVADRTCAGLLAVCFLAFRPDMAVPVALFLVQFMFVDCALSLSFLRWPIRSPNYFHVVHLGIHRLNWSVPAKAANTALLLIVMVATGSALLASVLAAAQLALKAGSLSVVARLLATAGRADARAEHARAGCPHRVSLAVGVASALLPLINAERSRAQAPAFVEPGEMHVLPASNGCTSPGSTRPRRPRIT